MVYVTNNTIYIVMCLKIGFTMVYHLLMAVLIGENMLIG